MDDRRRKRLNNVISSLGVSLSELQSLQAEEQQAFDNMPESLQNGENADRIQENADNLDGAASDLELVIDTLNEI